MIVSFRVVNLSDKVILAQCYNGNNLVTSDCEELLRFLVTASDAPFDAPRVVFNLKDLMNSIKSLLSAEHLAGIESDEHRADWRTADSHYRLYYLPGKFIGIHAGGWVSEVTFYELDQFLPDGCLPTTVEETQSLADELVKTFNALGVKTITNLKSPVSVLEESDVLKSLYSGLPNVDDIPDGCKEFAALSDVYGVWSGAYQIGYWKKAYSYDISSCYPYLASRLLNLTGAKYEYSKSMIDGAVYGFLKGAMTIYPKHPLANYSPIVASAGNIVTNPVGTFKGVFTTDQVRFVLQREMGEFSLASGWFITASSGNRPFFDIMTSLYRRRAESAIMSLNAKRVMTGIIGRLGEYHGNVPTPRTNPVYHSIITNSAPIVTARFIADNGFTDRDIIHINTDGFHSATERVQLNHQKTMGGWRCDELDSLLVLSSDKMIEGERCDATVASIRADCQNHSYPELGINLFSLAGSQERLFRNYPLCGSELLNKKYYSKPVEVK